MEKIIEIKENDIVKYLKSTYLVKSFRKLENGRYQLDYYFRTIRKENAKVHKNKTDEFYGFHAENIKKANEKERKFLISRIRAENPDFDLSKLQKNYSDLNEKECIDFLKERGFIIYKQV